MTECSNAGALLNAGEIIGEQRRKFAGQRPLTLWLTGLSGSGKSTLAFSLQRALIESGRACAVLDGDSVRNTLNRDLGFSKSDRAENTRRIAEVSRLMNDAGLIVITALISPFRDDRASARDIIGHRNFREIYISTPLAVCEARDPKGLYRKARAGTVSGFTGISSPYEAPEFPDQMIDLAECPVVQAVSKMTRFLAGSKAA